MNQDYVKDLQRIYMTFTMVKYHMNYDSIIACMLPLCQHYSVILAPVKLDKIMESHSPPLILHYNNHILYFT